MRKKIFLQFFSVTLVAILLMFVFGIVAVNVNAKEMLQERLKEETGLACSLVRESDDFENFSRYVNDDAFRVTVLDLNGNVLFESDTNAVLENHIDREEIKNALNDTPTTVERYSETFCFNMIYYATKTTLADGTVIILRLAVKSSRLNSYFSVAIPIFCVVLIFALVGSLLISNLLSKKLAGKIADVGESLKSLNDGDYQPIQTNSGEPELYTVLNEINALNASTLENITTIQEEHKKLNIVLENVSQGIVALDSNRKIVFANKSMLKLFNASDLFVGKDFIYLADDMSFCEQVSNHLGEDYSFEYVYEGKNLSVVMKKMSDTGMVEDISSIVVITDMTKEKAVQKQKSDFFANASHELKTPVTVMQGLSEILLAKDTLDENSKKQIDRIHKESLRLTSLISDMLKLSKLEHGDEEVVNSTVKLRDVAEEVVQELSSEINAKNITVSVEGSAEINADGKKIFEVIENLCSNAVHYNKENGKITIEISENDKSILLKVSDTGIGIEKKNIPRLCERFYRVDKSRSQKTGGTGLGLAIVKHVCALYKAKLSINSEVDKGTVVTIIFPK